MSRLLRIAVLLGVGLLLSASPLAAQAERTSVSVTLPGSSARAFEQTKVAFVTEGLEIAQADASGGLLVSVPAVDNPRAFMRAAFSYRAIILTVGDSTRIVFSGTMRSVDAGAMSQAIGGVRMEDQGKPLTSRCRENSPCGKAWARLERLARAVAPPVAAPDSAGSR